MRVDEPGRDVRARQLLGALDRLRVQPAVGDPQVDRLVAAGQRDAAGVPAFIDEPFLRARTATGSVADGAWA
jgi:hypothetical protein